MARVQERKYGHVCVHMGGVSNAYSRIRMARARVHGWVGMEKQRRRRVHREATECIVFMGRQRNALCSWGGNGMHGRVHREGLDGTGDGNEAWRTAEQRKRIKNSSDRTEICKISYNFLNVATIWAVMLTKRIWAPKKP